MELSLNAIIIAKSSDDAEAFMQVLKPEFELPECDFVTTVHKAIQAYSEMDFQACFIGDHVTPEELVVFFRDLDKLSKRENCVFVQIRKTIAADFDRNSLQASGLSTVVTPNGTAADKTALRQAFDRFYFREEIKKRSYNVDKATDLLLKEIDRMARERRRGQKKTLSFVAQEFIENQAEFAQELIDTYYSKLTERVAEAKPEESLTVLIPKEILAKGLPGMTEEGYVGVSHRVWEKLLKLHGRKDGLAEPPTPAKDTPPKDS